MKITTDEIELLGYLIDRTSYINTYWNIYIGVAGSMAGVLVSGKVHLDRRVRLLLLILFGTFAAMNLGAIVAVVEQRISVLSLFAAESSTVLEAFHPVSMCIYVGVHIILDIAVMLFIWFVRERRDSSDERLD